MQIYFRHLINVLLIFFYQGSGGVTSLVNAVTEYNDAFNDVIDGKFSIIVEKENVGMYFTMGVIAFLFNETLL